MVTPQVLHPVPLTTAMSCLASPLKSATASETAAPLPAPGFAIRFAVKKRFPVPFSEVELGIAAEPGGTSCCAARPPSVTLMASPKSSRAQPARFILRDTPLGASSARLRVPWSLLGDLLPKSLPSRPLQNCRWLALMMVSPFSEAFLGGGIAKEGAASHELSPNRRLPRNAPHLLKRHSGAKAVSLFSHGRGSPPAVPGVVCFAAVPAGSLAMSAQGEITQLLADWSEGDEAAFKRLLPLVYNELHKLANFYMRRERQDHTLQTTALVHEAYLRLVGQQNVQWQTRAHFFAVAARAMRNILVDHA